MKPALLKNTTFYTLGQIFPQAAQFFLLPIYTQHLSPGEYGVLANVQALNAILVILYTFSLNKAITRLYFDFKTDRSKRDYLGTIFIGLAVTTVFVTGMLFSLNSVIGKVYANINFFPHLALGISSSAVATFFLVPKKAYFVREKANVFVLLTILEFIAQSLAIIVFVVYLQRGSTGYLTGVLLANIVLLPFFLFLAWKQINVVFKLPLFIKSVRFSAPLLPTSLFVWIVNLSDRVFIERYFDTHEVGIYALGYKLSTVAVILSAAFYKAYSPFFYRVAARYAENEAKQLLTKTNTVYLLLIVFSCSCIALFSKEIITLLFDARYHEAYKLLMILAYAKLFSGAMGVFSLSIKQSKRTVYLLYISLIGAIINIVLNFLLISQFGAYGAAWATLITFFLLLYLKWHYAKKSFYVAFSPRLVYALFVFFLLANLFFTQAEIAFFESAMLKVLIISLTLGLFYLKNKSEILVLLGVRKNPTK